MVGKDNRVTINDVAKMAGVSKGTVDRVLHDRGEVSPKSREKVLKVIEELGYKPNFYASILASQKKHRIVCVIPEYVSGDFWSLTARGVEESAETSSRFGVTVEVVTYDQYDVESFRHVCNRVLADLPSGVVVAPMFRVETLNFVKKLDASGVPYVYIDSKLEDDSYFAYFGMPMFQSGYLCADIMADGRSLEKILVVRIERDKMGYSDPTVARRTGFMEYMAAHCPDTQIVNVFIDPKSPEDIRRKLDEAFAGASGNIGVVMFNSRIHIVAEYIRERRFQGVRVVGFDALEKNLDAIRSGHVHVLIAQHSDRQAAAAVNALVDNLIHGEPVHKKDNYTQMDILNRFNCDYYM
ncbi:MAG: LacI family DNA-binding transcriptional regulator [Bacteroidales bacterium]|nr:LacI family DNA-binding transcriptional regulator [Bacteroidales bacterium]